MPKEATGTLKDYRVPLSPVLGCVGVAPGNRNQYRSGWLTDYGANMDS